MPARVLRIPFVTVRPAAVLAVVAVVLASAAQVASGSPASALPTGPHAGAAGVAAAATGGGLWHLDEEAGATVAVDSSGFGNDGVLLNGVVPGQPGYLNLAYSFTTRGSWVRVANDPSLNPGSSAFSYGAAVRLNVAPTGSQTFDIIRKGLSYTSGGEFKLEIIKDGKARCTAKDGAGNRLAILGPSISVANQQWHTIECGRDGYLWHVTVDGVSRTKSAALGGIANSDQLSIGSKYGQEDFTPGLVDETYLTIAPPA